MSDTHVENNKSKLLVEAIANGTVIDHIAPGQAINIIRMFKFLGKHNQLTVGFNLRSGELGHKDIIKISDVVFSPAQTEQIAVLAPSATINHIKDFKVVDKYKLRLPNETVVFSSALTATASPTMSVMLMLALRSPPLMARYI